MATNAGTLSIEIRANLALLERDMKKLSGTLRKQGNMLASLGDSFTKSLSIPIAAFGALSLKASDNVTKAQRSIRAQTGQTGKSLDDLVKSAKTVATQVPGAFDKTAEALAVLTNATGLTGKSLEDLTKNVAAASKLTGDDMVATATEAGKVFNSWNVATEDQVKTLTVFYRAAGLSNSSMVEMMSTVRGADEIFGAFGFTLDESVAMLTSFEKAGIDMGTAVSGLSSALRIFSNAGITDFRGALDEALVTMASSKDEAKANALAYKLFGKAAGADLVDALRDGKFNIEEVTKALTGSGDTILEAESQTRTLSDAFMQLNRAVDFALAPIGDVLTKRLTPKIDTVRESLTGLSNVFVNLSPGTQNFVTSIFGIVAAIGPVIKYIGEFEKNLANVTLLFSKYVGVVKNFGVLGGTLIGVLKLASGAALGFGAALAVISSSAGGGKFEDFLQGLVEFIPIFVTGVKNGLINGLSTAFSAVGDLFDAGFASLGPRAHSGWQVVIQGLEELWAQFIETFTRGLDELSKRWENFWTNFRNGIGILGNTFKIEAWQRWATAGAQAADTVGKGIEKVAQESQKTGNEVGKLQSGVTDMSRQGQGDIDALLKKFGADGGMKEKVSEATKAIEDMKQSLAELKSQDAIDGLKKSIEEAAKVGSSANFGGAFDQLREGIAKAELEGRRDALKEASKEELAQAQVLAREKAAYEVDIYNREVVEKQLEADKERHQKSVDFFQGLMEDLISGTRFDFEEQFKKAAVEIASEWLARLVEANILAADSFGSLFSKLFGTLGDAFTSFFGQAAGGSIAGTAAGTVTASGLPVAAGWTSSGLPAAAGGGGGAAAMGGLSMAGIAAAAAVGAYVVQDNFTRLKDTFGGNTKTEKKVFDSSTALLDMFAPGIGTITNKIFGGMFGGSKLTPNQASIKKFEGAIEDALKQATGRSLNFVVGNIDKFAPAGWAEKFWGDFGDKGAIQFDALGKAFEQIMGLEKGVGGQLGQLLAENLAGPDMMKSLDNMKLFMDSFGISTEQVTEALFQLAAAGDMSWHEFEVLRMSMSQIPEEGVAGFGDLKGAMDQVLQSGGRGIQALIGLKNVAVEAAEKGVTSFEALRAELLNAGYDIDTVNAFFQALAQRGIESIDALKGASQETLGGVIADMESAGVKWEKWTEDVNGLNGAVANLTTGIGALAEALRDIPTNITTTIEQKIVPASGGDLEVTPHAKGGIVSSPTFFANGGMSLGVAGEAGPEGILPLKRVGGVLGVTAEGLSGGRGINIYVDAPGAEAGVEKRVVAALELIGPSIVNQAVEVITEHMNRGVY